MRNRDPLLDALLDEAREHDPLVDHRHPDRATFRARLDARNDVTRRGTTSWRSVAAAIALALSVVFALSQTSTMTAPENDTDVAVDDPVTEFEVVAWTDDLETRVELGDVDALVVLSELDALEPEHVDEFLVALFDGV